MTSLTPHQENVRRLLAEAEAARGVPTDPIARLSGAMQSAAALAIAELRDQGIEGEQLYFIAENALANTIVSVVACVLNAVPDHPLICQVSSRLHRMSHKALEAVVVEDGAWQGTYPAPDKPGRA